MIVLMAVEDLPEFHFDEEAAIAVVNTALDILVQRSDIQTFGNIRNWRHSEIRRVMDMERLDAQIARKMLDALDLFSGPINNLDGIIRDIDDEDLRRRFLRILGDVMGELDGKIGYEARQALKGD